MGARNVGYNLSYDYLRIWNLKLYNIHPATSFLNMIILEPLMLFKVNHTEQGNDGTDDNNRRIAVSPAVLRHWEIHSIPAHEQSQRQEDRGDDRK